jgi:uncharacterized protein
MLIMSTNRLPARALLAALLLTLTACIGGKTPPSQFYLLEPMRGAEPAAEADKLVIALAPLRIPPYVDRPQIVTATDRNTYALSEFNRWAERLDDNITRVLSQNLSMLVPADLVSLNTASLAKRAALRLTVTILEFHVDPQGQAQVIAQWRIARGENIVASQQGTYREPASITDYRVMAGALNTCLNRLSRDIAMVLRQLVADY